MRFRLILEVNKRAFGNRLPINYQYEQSAAIYKILSYGDKEYAAWLHENGFQLENGKTFKLFTFSRFKIEKRKVLEKEERIVVLSDTVEWQISFLPEKSTREFVTGLFTNQIFEIGDKKSIVQLVVKSIEAMPSPAYSSEMVFKTMSPMCLRFMREDSKIDYLSPTDVRSKKILIQGLLDRYCSYYGTSLDCSWEECNFEVLDEPQSKLVLIKAGTKERTQVRGYECTFKISAPVELLQLMYESGAGSLCAQGFGCLRVLK